MNRRETSPASGRRSGGTNEDHSGADTSAASEPRTGAEVQAGVEPHVHADNHADAENPRSAAWHFTEHETAFHLGFLPTEQPHAVTIDLSQAAAADPKAAVDRILQVDGDIAPVARRVVLSPEFDSLVSAIRGVAVGSGRVVFSGCGSTGRLAIILEAMWRRALAGSPEADRAASIMTGGDRALIRAVEHFEDYEHFGARQVADLDIRDDDVFIAISEGGETSSVIGTVREAADRGATSFFLYNNPTRLLASNMERSRRVIEDDRVTCLDLFSGPMALSGSTRMQATTLELLVCGIAMEEALGSGRSRLSRTEALGSNHSRLSRVDAFASLLRSLREPGAVEAIGRIAELEADIYNDGGLVTYFADNFLLDVFSDTTERSPTFMIPPFRRNGDRDSLPAWAFAKDAHYSTTEAWPAMLGRAVRGIEWSSDDYRAMNAPDALVSAPPQLDAEEIHSYAIGNDPDPSRTDCPRATAIRTAVVDSIDNAPATPTSATAEPAHAYRTSSAAGADRAPERGPATAPDLSDFHECWNLMIARTPQPTNEPGTICIPAEITDSPVELFDHLAVKLVFNTFSTTTMAMLGRIHGNWMIQLNPTNKKLIDRGTRIIAHLASLDYAEACVRLHEAMADSRRNRANDTPAAANGAPSTTESPVVLALRRLGVLKEEPGTATE